MPKYNYRCKDCDSQYEIWHGMTEDHSECNVCSASSVVRIPSLLGEVINNDRKRKVGNIVNSTIEETREEIREYKKKLGKELDK
jgi:putative FmdB family regulatory protein